MLRIFHTCSVHKFTIDLKISRQMFCIVFGANRIKYQRNEHSRDRTGLVIYTYRESARNPAFTVSGQVDEDLRGKNGGRANKEEDGREETRTNGLDARKVG